MKILLFHPWLKSKGGAERIVYEYYKRSKHKIKISTWNYIKELGIILKKKLMILKKKILLVYMIKNLKEFLEDI